jgi:uncharacterized protein
MRHLRHHTFVLGLLCLLAPTAAGALDVPYLSGRVVDLAELLPPQAEQEIDATLAALERETGAQVAVLTIPTLGDEPLEDYAVRVAETWKLGREGVDDGVLLLVAQQERGLRLEVGYGLEPKLPDAIAKRILDERVVPRFRDGDFPGGIAAGVDAVAVAVRGGDPLPPPAPRSPGTAWPLAPRIGFGLGALVFLVPFASAALFTRGGGGWFLWLFLTPFLAIFPYFLLGPRALLLALAWLVGFPPLKLWIARQQKKGRLGGGASKGRGPGGWGGWGGFGGFGGMGGMGGRGWSSRGGGFGGGGFGGGGFSGGGGSFGGGGASSRW